MGKKMYSKLLRPCPFCGEKPTSHIRFNADWDAIEIGISCGKCGICIDTNVDNSYKAQEDPIDGVIKLINKWNGRAGREEE